MKIRVYYEDTDTGGVVYHSNYLNFCERARSEAFFRLGMSPELSSGHFVAKRIEADYIASAKLGDLLEVRTELLDMKGASFVLKQTITKEEKKIFELVISLVYIDFQGRPKRIDQEVKQLLLSLF
jgi:acyl-CoA thioester hydrolase